MKLIDRYMSAVAHYLPESRREEITRELRANILDRLEHFTEEKGREIYETEVSVVLSEMGHPQLVAARFLPPRRLVSEDLFPIFKEALSYTLMFVLIVKVIQAGGIFLSSGQISIPGLLLGFANTALLVFASVTGIFYLFSNPPGGKPLFRPYACWKPEQLPPVTRPWQRISFCEQASEFSINVFFLLVLQYLLWASAEAVNNLSVTFAEPALPWLLWMTALILFSMLLNLWNFRFGFWSKPKLIMSGAINLGSALILVAVSRLPEILALVPGAEARVWDIEAANNVIKVGLLLTGLWLLYDAGRDFYRVYLIRRE